ncbi:MAG: hypothetical protein HUK24_07705 [Sphaerochaetaceae bacterium]|nr:hypothetical protein [Sphaerochaetaceae bacterium]
MKKNIILFILSIVVVSSMFATDSSDFWKDRDIALGTSYLISSGPNIYGLSYQKWYGDFGLELCGGGEYRESYYSDGPYSMANGSVKGQFSVYENNGGIHARIYTWLLLCAVGEYEAKTKDLSYDIGGGFGFGCELVLWNLISIPLEFGYAGGAPSNPAFGYCFSSGIRFRM